MSGGDRDVSHYVKVGSALDGDAYDRGNSGVFPAAGHPMLPEKLSGTACVPSAPRSACAWCATWRLPDRVIKRYRFYPAVMFSKARLTYSQVAAAYDNDPAALG